MTIQTSAEISAAAVPSPDSQAPTSNESLDSADAATSSGSPASASIESPESLESPESPESPKSIAPSVEASASDVVDEVVRATDPPATRPESPSARIAVASKIDTTSVAPVTRDAGPDLDFDDEQDDHGFFSKSLEEVHAEEVKKELAVHDDFAAPPVTRRRVPDHRARSIVVGVLGVCALIGATAMVRKATSATRSHGPTTSIVAAQAAQPAQPAMETAAPAPVAPIAAVDPAPTTIAEPAPTPATTETTPPAPAPMVAETAAPAAATAAAPTTTTTTAATTATTTATTATTTATTAETSEAAAADPEASMSAGQLLAAARSAINGNNASRAANLAKKAISKGAGGSAHYVLGAAYQLMGANMGAKNEYRQCAKSGAPEASECAALVDSL